MRLRDLLMIHGSSVTYRSIASRRRLGWRESDRSDRRVSLVRLTAQRREVVDRASALLVESEFGLFAALDEDRIERFSDFLADLRQEGEARAQA